MLTWVVAASWLALSATLHALAGHPPIQQGETMTLGDVTFVPIPAGEFAMGDGSRHGLLPERPVHSVKVNAFWMAQTEITFTQWKAFLDDAHRAPGRSTAAGNDHPIVGITWDDARAYCAWFSKKYGVVARLPSEAEWEYAARGGLEGKQYPNGDAIAATEANYDRQGTVRVGSFPSNGFGLYDMAGNVAEWVADWYDRDYYQKSPRDNPKGPATDTHRPQRHVDRGGGWCMDASMARVAARQPGPDSFENGGTAGCLGFRPVVEQPPASRE
jgi:formylglycine-generating enzyme required for sulfatase activity